MSTDTYIINMEPSDMQWPDQNNILIELDRTDLNSNKDNLEAKDAADLIALLKSWNQEYLADHLIEQKVYVNVLKVIKEKHIDKLLKNYEVGVQILFENNLEMWRKGTLVSSILDSDCPASPSSSSASDSCNTNITLGNILNQSSRGLKLTEYYSKNNKFLDEHRTLLVNLIAEYCIEKSYHFSLTTASKLEHEIIERFPTEKLEFYRIGKRGRIYNKFCNLKSRQLKICKTNDSDIPKEKKSKQEMEPEENVETIVRSLKFDNLTVEEFDSLWQACANYRLNTIKNADSLMTILNKWPEYKKPSGYRLIDMDYCSLFKNTRSIVDNWENEAHKLVNFLSTSIKEKHTKILFEEAKTPSANENGRIAALLLSLHGYLVPTNKTVKKDLNGSNTTIKFTIKDSQESFLYWGRSTQEVKDHLDFLVNRKENIQPFILVVGDKVTLITEIFVYCGGIMYNFKNLLRAVDICYKAFHLFDLKYPPASIMFWDFIEQYFYISSNKSKHTKVHVLITELNSGSY